MLADTGHEDAVVGRVVAQRLDHELRLERTAFFLRVLERVVGLPFVQLRDPRRDVGRAVLGVLGLHGLDQLFDDGPHVADDRHVGVPDLAELGRIDVDVDDLGVGREAWRPCR